MSAWREDRWWSLSPPGSVVGELAEDVANETGLPPGLPVVGGAGDGQAAGLGANVTEAGQAYLNLGTALVSGTYSDDYAWGREFRTLAGPIPKTYVPETLLRGGTYTIDWFVDNFGGIKPSDLGLDLSAEQVLETAAGQVPPGAEGLLLLPYLNAASTPYWDSQARGVLFGLRGTHNKAHVYRAVLEGLAFEQRVETEAMERGLGQSVDRYFAMGGGSRSPLFCQMIADITGRPVTACKEVETTCLGAAMMAAAAMDDSGELREIAANMSGEGASYEPDEQRSAFYDRIYNDVFKELYPSPLRTLSRARRSRRKPGRAPDIVKRSLFDPKSANLAVCDRCGLPRGAYRDERIVLLAFDGAHDELGIEPDLPKESQPRRAREHALAVNVVDEAHLSIDIA